MRLLTPLLLSGFAALLLACGADAPDCVTSNDCGLHAICSVGQCVDQPVDIDDVEPSPGAGPIVVAPRDGGRSHGSGDSPDLAPAFECREARQGDLSIEEVLANVPAGEAGDANGDGARDAYDDEFVEISNRSSEAVGLRGVELVVNGASKYTFDVTDCLDARGVIVAFSGGPAGPERRVAGKRLGLGNGGGTVELLGAAGEVLDSVTYGDVEGSWVRSPVFDGPHLPHSDVSELLFSPGRCVDGNPWDGACETTPEENPDAG